jgi:hypothetical protein
MLMVAGLSALAAEEPLSGTDFAADAPLGKFIDEYSTSLENSQRPQLTSAFHQSGQRQWRELG